MTIASVIKDRQSRMIEVFIPNQANNPTYLHSALYRVTRHGQTLEFRNAFTGGGTSEQVRMFDVFVKQGRVQFQDMGN